MSTQSNLLFEAVVTQAGWQYGLVKKDDDFEKSPLLTSYKKQIARTVFNTPKNDPSIDAIYFSGNFPFIYFKKLSEFDPTLVPTFNVKYGMKVKHHY